MSLKVRFSLFEKSKWALGSARLHSPLFLFHHAQSILPPASTRFGHSWELLSLVHSSAPLRQIKDACQLRNDKTPRPNEGFSFFFF